MNYFFVFQNKTYEKEHKGEFLWAPQYRLKNESIGDIDGNRAKVSHWTLMEKVKKGDIIIHSFNQKIVAISIAKEDSFADDRPAEFESSWVNKGWRVNSSYITFKSCIKTSDNMRELMKLLPEDNAPFNKIGRGNTGYLFKATKGMFTYIIRQTAELAESTEEKEKILNLLELDFEYLDAIEDESLNDEINETSFEDVNDNFEYNHNPKTKEDPITKNGVKVYHRDKKVSMNALGHANYKCEIDSAHITFIRRKSKKNYTEPHHLIPMKYSDRFEVSLDVEENIVSLCSNCHNQIHYGEGAKELVLKLFNERKEHLEKVGLFITEEELLHMYGL